MSRKKSAIWVFRVIGLVLMLSIGTLAFGDSVSAAGSGEYTSDYITKRVLYQKLKSCYEGSIKDEISYVNERTDDYSFGSFLTGSGASIFKEGGTSYVPTDIGFSTDSLKCLDPARKGKNTEKNLMSYLHSKSSWLSGLSGNGSDVRGRTEYYTNMGFAASSSKQAANSRCYTLTYKKTSPETDRGVSNTLCLEFDEDGFVNGVKSNGISQPGENEFAISLIGVDSGGNIFSDNIINTELNDCDDDSSFHLYRELRIKNKPAATIDAGCYGSKNNTSVTIDNIDDHLKAILTDTADGNFKEIDFYKNLLLELDVQDGSVPSGGEEFDTYTFNSNLTSANLNAAIAKLEGVDIRGAPAWAASFANDELYYVYLNYLTKKYTGDAAPKIDFDSCTSSDGGESYLPIVFGEDGSKVLKWCNIANYGNLEDDLYGNAESSGKLSLLDGGSWSSPKTVKTIDMVKKIRELGNVDASRLPSYENLLNDASKSWTEDDNGENDGNAGDAEKTCANQGGAGSLGWIVCPIMTWLGNAAQDAYEDFVEPSLRIEPKLFSEGNEGVRNGWETFRNIANIAFIILLLVVIFSQLTGVGIDNYGIKKILPKMIVVAILINLSYLICILAVDLSNILGNALRSLFDGLSANLGDVSLNIPNAELNDDAIGKTVLTGIGVLGTLVLMGGSIWQNPAILLSMLVGALGVAISIFFLFVLLAVREAAIVVLMVISPLAVACYMLPNTKKLFDKWLKFFEGLLLVYPICGLLVGGGNYISTLLLSAGFGDAGFLQAFTAMIVGIVPIFFIPTVLKGSFAAMGTIGGMLTGLGKGASGLATKKIRSSEGYKAAQVRGLERKTRKKAGLDAEGQPTWKGAMKSKIAGSRLGRAFGYQKLQAARVSAANKTREQDIQQAAELKDIGMKYDVSNDPTKSTEERLTEKLDAAAASGDTNEIFSVIEQMRRSNMQDSHIALASRKAIGNNLNIKDAGKRKNFLEEFGKKYSGDFLKKDFEQADWARKGGVGVNGISALGVGGQWASRANAAGKTNMTVDDMKDEDVAALSSDRLYDMIAAGVISQPQAQRVWSANGNMDDTNRLILGAYGNEGMILSKQQAQQQLNPRTRTMDEETVKAYTERAATDTRIRDVEWRDSKGRHQQTDPLINQQRDGGSSAGNNGGSELKIDHKKFSDERMSDGQSGYD